MICLVILFIDLFIKSITGNGFVEEPVLLVVTGCLEMVIVLIAAAIYQTITGKDLL